MNDDLSRRDFSRWTAAAFGGLMSGSLAGCGGSKPATPPATGDGKDKSGTPQPPSATTRTPDPGQTAANDPQFLLAGKNVCRGLNTCKNHKGGDNACAGMGACALAEAHSCGGDNACKGQGGCGEFPGQNSCKGTGGCHVPLMGGAWTKARAAFEKVYKAKHGKDLGAAPAAAGKPAPAEKPEPAAKPEAKPD